MDAEAVKSRGAAMGLKIIREAASLSNPSGKRRAWMLAEVADLSVGDNIAGLGLVHSIERTGEGVKLKCGIDRKAADYKAADQVFAFTTGTGDTGSTPKALIV